PTCSADRPTSWWALPSATCSPRSARGPWSARARGSSSPWSRPPATMRGSRAGAAIGGRSPGAVAPSWGTWPRGSRPQLVGRLRWIDRATPLADEDRARGIGRGGDELAHLGCPHHPLLAQRPEQGVAAIGRDGD